MKLTENEKKTLRYALSLARDRVVAVDPVAFNKPGQSKHLEAWKQMHLNGIASLRAKLDAEEERDEQAVAGETARQIPN